MEILLNGNVYILEMEKKLSELLTNIDFYSGAVAVNNNIVHKEHFDSTIIRAGDKVDIVTVVGGG